MRYIKLTEDLQLQLVTEFANKLKQQNNTTDTITFTASINKQICKERPVVTIETEAYAKMLQLTLLSSDEVGWHGMVHRDGLHFTITDIVVYPQTVTGATVKTDTTEYTKWLMSVSDEDFPHLRFHGHSHVNMGVSPSITDLTFYKELLDNMQKDDYYIFLIMNKSLVFTVLIYDLANNIIYDTADIDLLTACNSWAKAEVEQHVKKYTSAVNTTPITPTKPYGYSGYYGGYSAYEEQDADYPGFYKGGVR